MTRRRDLLPWRYVVPALWVVLADVWFDGPLLGRWTGPAAAIPVALALIAAAVALVRARPGADAPLPERRPFVLAVLGVALVATLLRLPALAAPASLISSDSAVAGIIAQEIAAGQLPAPIYAPGFPYEGTLKPHLTVLVSWLLPGGMPSAYAWTSHLFHLLWTAAVMVLARDLGGVRAALAAGLFMAVSPRFLVAFSLNNVGQYPEVNAIGALALVALARGATLGAGVLLGLAVWQQLLAVYFVAAAAVLVLLTPALRRPGPAARLAGGFFAGSYPMWAWNAANAWATFDLFRRGGKQPADRVAGLPESLERMVTASFPKLFGLTDLGVEATMAAVLGLVMPVLVVAMAWARRDDIRARRGRSPAAIAIVLLAVVVALFAVSKFSNRGAQRPRYLMPVYTSVAIAFGWAIASLARRSNAAAVAAAGIVLGANLAGLVPWLQGRAGAEARDRALLRELERLGIRTGYAGFWVAPKFTFLAEGALTLSGELGPVVSWVHPGHAARVREAGPDALIVGGGGQGDALSARLAHLGCAYRVTKVSGLAVFHDFCRRLTLEEVAAYDVRSEVPEPGDSPENDP